MEDIQELQSKISKNIANAVNKLHEEYQYINLLKKTLTDGIFEEGRNGKTKSIFGASMRFSLANDSIPILTTKRVAYKTCFKELLWFIRCKTDNTILQKQGVHIWDANSSREYLDSQNLHHYPENILGPIYGYQWRNYDAPYNPSTGEKYLNNVHPGVDQLQNIIDTLKDPILRKSRRIIMTAWNPKQLHEMALPPCHILCQFNVHDGNKLSCSLYQRSGDLFLGVPFNIASYALLTHLLAKHCGLEAYEFIHFLGNCHIYENAVEAVKTQLTREPYPFPIISIKQTRENINDYEIQDFEIHNYTSWGTISADMVP